MGWLVGIKRDKVVLSKPEALAIGWIDLDSRTARPEDFLEAIPYFWAVLRQPHTIGRRSIEGSMQQCLVPRTRSCVLDLKVAAHVDAGYTRLVSDLEIGQCLLDCDRLPHRKFVPF